MQPNGENYSQVARLPLAKQLWLIRLIILDREMIADGMMMMISRSFARVAQMMDQQHLEQPQVNKRNNKHHEQRPSVALC